MQEYTSAAMYQLHLLYAHLKLRLTFCPPLPLTLPCFGGAVDLCLLAAHADLPRPAPYPCLAFGRSICVRRLPSQICPALLFPESPCPIPGL
jgi:hypothetical protein